MNSSDVRGLLLTLQEFDHLFTRRMDAYVQAIAGGLRLGEVQANLMKWSFVFWCGAVAAIAALAGVLRSP